jgi:hypothetical protein
MKNILLFTGLFVLILASCVREPDPEPYASFGVDYSLVEPGEVVFFTNSSRDADYFEWDFGDGYSSTSFTPSHAYKNEGVYRVTLAAFNGKKVDYTYLDIEVYMTTLEVEVIEWRDDDLVYYIQDADVTLFTSYHDWDNMENPVISDYTDNNGVVVFKGVNTISYYIDVRNQSFDNNDLGIENVDNIMTLPLEYAQHNIFTAYVDRKSYGKMILKSTSRRVKSATERPTRSLKNLTRVKKREK